ncbi:MAG: succinate dehydrogenase, hydrophobic membrane anchor protein [Gammaproteobacteria bacterium]|nr:succinate dehydrogenase, hydrophobic membrane anchor protein [Gammaproteobacteria bacterium]
MQFHTDSRYGNIDMALGVSERGSSRSGLGEWVVQRLTAVYILIYIIVALVVLSFSPVTNHAGWLSLSSGLIFQISTLMFIFSILAHAWLGLKSVFLDYVHSWRVRFVLLMLLATLLIGSAIWALLVVGRMM